MSDAPAPDRSTEGGTYRTPWLAPLMAALVAVAWRGSLVWQFPTAYAFDGYQRWGGREHILVQDWLPATQSLIWAVAKLGGGIREGRIAMVVVSGLAAVFGTLLAQRLAGSRLGPSGAGAAGWAFVVATTFGPWSGWGTVFYQESTFLAVLFGALTLMTYGHLRVADVVIGALGLVRYEGWPCVLLYLAWRRDPRAAVGLWGIATWLGIRAFGPEGYAASPVNFADWEGLGARFSWGAYLNDVDQLWFRVFNSLGIVWLILGAIGLRALRTPHAWLVAACFAAQVGTTLAWLAGLEVSTSRMLVIPIALAATLGASGAAWLAQQRWTQWVVPIGLAVVLGAQLEDGRRRVRVETTRVAAEVAAVAVMEECPGCTWWVLPRRRLGTRERHDGCEVIQGISNLREGVEFHCAPWVEPEAAMANYSSSSGTIRWDGSSESYVMERHLPGRRAPPELPQDMSEAPVGTGAED